VGLWKTINLTPDSQNKEKNFNPAPSKYKFKSIIGTPTCSMHLYTHSVYKKADNFIHLSLHPHIRITKHFTLAFTQHLLFSGPMQEYLNIHSFKTSDPKEMAFP
jgi:hypothetical protein